MLELYEVKVSRTVLRGERGGDTPALPGLQEPKMKAALKLKDFVTI